MTRAAKKVLAILHRHGFTQYKEITVHRSYAGKNQKADGWCVWLARSQQGMIICGGQAPIKDLRTKTAIMYQLNREWWMEQP